MDAPTSVASDERFQLNITVNANPTSFTPPNLKDFNILMGPSESSGSSVSNINGKITQVNEFTYSYILQPKKAGKFDISAAEYTVNGKKYPSNSLSIEVVGNASQSSSGSSAPGANQTIDESGDLFLKVFLDKNSAYQGEFIVGTVKMYTRLNVKSITPVVLPSFDGFYTQEIETPQLRQLQREIVKGKEYGTGVVKKFVLIPQKTGDHTIGSSVMQCGVEVRSNNGFFDDFFPSPVELVQKEAKSKPFKISVKPLPNRPASFTGAVGKFNFQANYDKTKVKENDPVILKLSITGAGNLKLIEAPKISFQEGIETSDPTTINKTNDKDGGISGTKQFEYLLIPRAPGKMTLPPIEFSYFDPIARQFKTLSTPATALEVEPGDGSSRSSGNMASQEDLKFIEKDIEYINLYDIKLKRTGSILFGSVVFYLGYIIPLFLLISLLIFRRNYIRQNSNTVLTRNRKAQKYATKRLKNAKEYLAASKKENFYEEVLKALWGYLSDKLSMPVSELSRENARDQLLQAGVDEESINRMMSLIATCEYARYAPATMENTMETDYKEAVFIITQIQEKIR